MTEKGKQTKEYRKHLEKLVNEGSAKLKESEDKYWSVLEQSADCIYLLDIETKKILESNTTLKNLLGYTSEEMKNLTVYNFISHSKDNINKQINLTLKERKLFIGDRKYIRKDGSLVDVEVSTNIIKHANKKILCVVSRDITERKIKEKELLLNKQAISSSINCLIIADFDGKIQHINNAGVEMFGFTQKEFEGKNITSNFITNQPIILEIIKTVNKKGIYYGEQKLARKDHSEFYAQITANVIKDKRGNSIALMASLIDISQRKEAEIQLELQKTYFEHLFEVSPEAIAILDLDDRIIEVNKEFCNVFEFSENEVIGEKINDLLVPSDLAKEGEKNTELVSKGKNVLLETIRQTKSGKLINESGLTTPKI